MAECIGCGTKKATLVRTWWEDIKDENMNVIKTEKREACNECGNQKPDYPRDAFGNRVSVPTDLIGKFSYATGTRIESSRQYANTLRKMNLVQKEA